MDNLFGPNLLGRLEMLKSFDLQLQRNGQLKMESGQEEPLAQQQQFQLLAASQPPPLQQFFGNDPKSGAGAGLDLISQLRQLAGSPLAPMTNGNANGNGKGVENEVQQQQQQQRFFWQQLQEKSAGSGHQQQQQQRQILLSREKKKFSQEVSDFLVLEVLKRKELLVENNTSRDLTFSESKRNAWNVVRGLLMRQFPGFELGIEAIKSHWRYRKRKITDAFGEIQGADSDVKMRNKFSSIDYEIFVQLKDSNMLENCKSGTGDELSPSETSDEPASVPNQLLGIGGGMSASNSPFPFCVDFPPPLPPASAAVERSTRDSAAATQMLLFQQLSASLMEKRQQMASTIQQNNICHGNGVENGQRQCHEALTPNAISNPALTSNNVPPSATDEIEAGKQKHDGIGIDQQQQCTRIGLGRKRRCEEWDAGNGNGEWAEDGRQMLLEADEENDLKRKAIEAQLAAYSELRLAASAFRTELLPELLAALRNYNSGFRASQENKAAETK